MSLRPYQQEAVDSVVAWCRKTTSPCVVEAPTGAGKSHIIAAIAAWLHKVSEGKSVLCIAPSAELVVQNREKYMERTGRPAGLISASAGKVTLRYPVAFGTPGTVINRTSRLAGRVCAVVIDECHGVTPTILQIIEDLRAGNKNLRVIGLTATPYRLGSGYIYREDEAGKAYGEDRARDPYFVRRVYAIDARELIESGYLTPPLIGVVRAGGYDTSGLTLNRMGQFASDSVDRAFVGHGRKTADIVAEVVEQSRDRRGVLFFGATVPHAREILASLNPDLSALVTGETPKKERARIIEDFKSQKIKYLVNVSVLTTGFDAPHADVVALLRATESVALMQQMIGRGLRLYDGKDNCLILDYAGNLERHCPDGDVFSPDITADKGPGGDQAEVICPDCTAVNLFTIQPDFEGMMDAHGYVVDLTGQRIETEYGPQPGHYGRRCNAMLAAGPTHVRCSYRWTFKTCDECDAENDIAARRCCECKAEIVDPNERLQIEFAARKRDPYQIQCDPVESWAVSEFTSRKGNPCVCVDIRVPARNVELFFTNQSGITRVQKTYDDMEKITEGWTKSPETITYRKDAKSGYYRLIDVNQPADEAPDEVSELA